MPLPTRWDDIGLITPALNPGIKNILIKTAFLLFMW